MYFPWRCIKHCKYFYVVQKCVRLVHIVMLTFKTTGEIDCASNSIEKTDLLSQKKKINFKMLKIVEAVHNVFTDYNKIN